MISLTAFRTSLGILRNCLAAKLKVHKIIICVLDPHEIRNLPFGINQRQKVMRFAGQDTCIIRKMVEPEGLVKKKNWFYQFLSIFLLIFLLPIFDQFSSIFDQKLIKIDQKLIKIGLADQFLSILDQFLSIFDQKLMKIDPKLVTEKSTKKLTKIDKINFFFN